jgi:uncharacterized membrane protein
MPKIDLSAVLIAAISILYPLLAAFAVRAFGPAWVVGGLCVLLLARGVFGLTQKIPAGLTIALLAVALAMAGVALIDRALSVRLYPAFMSTAMMAAFAYSLFRPPSIIERFARLVEPDLPESGVRYTRTVTKVWVAFLLGNAAIATWTAFYADWNLWTLYNGVISYVAMGALFAVEFVVRGFVRARAEPNP